MGLVTSFSPLRGLSDFPGVSAFAASQLFSVVVFGVLTEAKIRIQSLVKFAIFSHFLLVSVYQTHKLIWILWLIIQKLNANHFVGKSILIDFTGN